MSARINCAVLVHVWLSQVETFSQQANHFRDCASNFASMGDGASAGAIAVFPEYSIDDPDDELG